MIPGSDFIHGPHPGTAPLGYVAPAERMFPAVCPKVERRYSVHLHLILYCRNILNMSILSQNIIFMSFFFSAPHLLFFFFRMMFLSYARSENSMFFIAIV